MTNALDKSEATKHIQKWSSEKIQKQDQTHFVGIVEDELLALHSGSIYRFGITLEQFENWQTKWNK